MNVGRDNAARIRHNLALCTSRCRNAVLYDNADHPQGIHMTLQFNELGLAAPLTQAVADAGYENTTLVQAQAIPAALAGKDLLVSAQTGSGKTAAFLLPSMQKLLARSEKPGKGPRVLVLTPTRELAQQVEKNAQQYGEKMRWLRTVTLVGGTSYGLQSRLLARPIDIVVATPGRLMDHMRQGRIDFSRLEVLVLDEADRMLDMGFIDDIEHIIKATPADRQTLMFSATLDGTIGALAQRMTRNPERIEIARVDDGGVIEEHLMYCDDARHKERILDAVLRDSGYEQCVIFTATKVGAEELADKLDEQGYSAACLHGDMPQGWRNRTLNALRNGRTKILVATDVAARGIDVPAISHVINYDLPKQAEDYVHRIGRTGRAGRDGMAITLAEVRDHHKVRKIEQYLQRTLPEGVIEGMEPTRRIPRGNGKGRSGGGGNGQRHHHKKPHGQGQGNNARHGRKPNAQGRQGGGGGRPQSYR